MMNSNDQRTGPNTQPLPNPWSGGSRQPQRQRLESLEDVRVEQRRVMTYYAVDGTIATTQLSGEREGGSSLLGGCCTSCCPCCVGGHPCAPERKTEYKRLLIMFCFLISVVHLALLIAELSLYGFASYNANPDFGPPSEALVKLGAKHPALMRYNWQVWRFLTSNLLHGGIIHFILNTFALLRMGVVFERRWGIVTTIIIYVVSGIGATLFSCLIFPNKISVGASGAICGLLGASASELMFTWKTLDARYRVQVAIQTAFSIVLLLAIGAFPYIDSASHAGGVLVGFLLGFWIFGKNSMTFTSGCVVKSLPFVGLLTTIVYFIIGFVCFYTVVHPNQ